MLVRLPPIERSIETPFKYQIERVASDAFENDFPEGTPETVIQAWRGNRITQQCHQVDERDAMVRACYGLPRREYGYDRPRSASHRPATAAAKTATKQQDPVTDGQRKYLMDLQRLCETRGIPTSDLPGPRSRDLASQQIDTLRSRLGLPIKTYKT